MHKENSNLLRIYSTIIFVSFSIYFFGQGYQKIDTIQTIYISYGQKLNHELIGLNGDEIGNWIIKSADNITLDSQKIGLGLFDITWNTPGFYGLELKSKHQSESGCIHDIHLNSYNVSISPFHVLFKIDEITFSKEFSKESLETGLILTVPVEFMSINEKQEFNTDALKVNFQGLGCHVKVRSIPQNVLIKSGSFNLQYEIIGIVEKDSYIMIDFYDHNGNITTYYHLNKL
jgi:hypothetical protein